MTLAAELAKSDFYVYPCWTISYSEGFSVSTMEAMAAGKVVVGGAHGGTPDIIEDGVTGYLVPYGDGMSASRDLGYSYGLLIARPSGAAAPDTVSYLHVWRRDAAGRWKLALDVENAFGKSGKLANASRVNRTPPAA